MLGRGAILTRIKEPSMIPKDRPHKLLDRENTRGLKRLSIMPSAIHPGNLSKLLADERARLALKLQEVGVPARLLEDQLQDFFVYLLEWADRSGKVKLAREELWGRVEIYLRNLKRKGLAPDAQDWETVEAHLETPRGVERTIDVDFEQAMIDREQVVRFLGCMTEKSQIAVIVYYLIGLTREEMADVWGVSANTVATQAFRGIRQARAFGPRVPLEDGCEMLRVNSQRVALPMEWGAIPLELSERSAHLVQPWYESGRADKRWVRRPPFGTMPRSIMLWPQPSPGSARSKARPGSRLAPHNLPSEL